MTYLGLIKSDLKAAGLLIEAYRKSKEKSDKNLAAYHIQQAIEKIIKEQIYNSGAEYNDHKLYTHNIRRLIIYASDELNLNISVPENIMKNARLITDWAVTGRYDIHLAADIRTVEKVYSEALTWYEQIRKK